MLVRKELIPEIFALIAEAKEKAISSIDSERVLMYWNIGRKILNKNSRAKTGRAMVSTSSDISPNS